jgi:hypothetical protein
MKIHMFTDGADKAAEFYSEGTRGEKPTAVIT